MRRAILYLTAGAVLLLIAAAPEHGGGDSLLKIILKTLNLILFFGGLTYLLARPFGTFVSGRDTQIREKLAEAKQKEEQAENLKEEIDRKIASFKEEEESLRGRFEEEMGRLEKEARANLERDVKNLESLVVTLTEQHGRQVKEQLQQEVKTMAIKLAEELLEKEVSPEDRERFMATILEELSA